MQHVRDLSPVLLLREVVEHRVFVVLQEPLARRNILALPKPQLSAVVRLAAHEVQAHAVVLDRDNAKI